MKLGPTEGDWIHNRFFPKSRIKADPAACFCGGRAILRVGDKGFCGKHRAEARAAEDARWATA